MDDTTAFEAVEASPAEAYAPQAEAEPATEEFHEHQIHDSTEDIQQQADDILKSIRSPETEDGVEAVAPEEPQLIEPIAPVAGPESAHSDNPEISEAQRILSEILEHKNLLNDQMGSSSPADHNLVSGGEPPQSVPMQQSGSESPTEQDTPDQNPV